MRLLSIFKKNQNAAREATAELLMIVEDGALNIDSKIKKTISSMISRSQKSRWEIITQLNRLCGTEYQKSTLDGWCAESREDSNAPLKILPALTVVTQSFELLRLLGTVCGCRVLRDSEGILAEIAKIEHAQKELEDEKDKLRELYLKLKK